MAHTKGNWVYDNEGVITSDNNLIVADVLWDKRLSLNEGNDNLKLMAAAPEMIDALLAARAIFQGMGITEKDRIVGEQFSKIQNAILKAGV